MFGKKFTFAFLTLLTGNRYVTEARYSLTNSTHNATRCPRTPGAIYGSSETHCIWDEQNKIITEKDTDKDVILEILDEYKKDHRDERINTTQTTTTILNTSIFHLNTTLTNVNTALTEVSSEVGTVQSTVSTLLDSLSTFDLLLLELSDKTRENRINNELVNHKIDTLALNTSEAVAKLDVRITHITHNISMVNNRISDLYLELSDDAAKKKELLLALRSEFFEKTTQLERYAQSLAVKINDLQSTIKNLLSEIESKFSTLANRVSFLESRVGHLDTEMSVLKIKLERFNYLKATIEGLKLLLQVGSALAAIGAVAWISRGRDQVARLCCRRDLAARGNPIVGNVDREAHDVNVATPNPQPGVVDSSSNETSDDESEHNSDGNTSDRESGRNSSIQPPHNANAEPPTPQSNEANSSSNETSDDEPEQDSNNNSFNM